MTQPTVVVAVGVSASGKSTYLKPLAMKLGAVYVCVDDVRTELVGAGADKSQNHRVWQEVQKRVKAALARGVDRVIVDSDGVEPRIRRHDVEFYRGLGARVVAYWCEVPVETALRRNAGRAHRSAEHLIRHQAELLEADPPTVDEGFDEVILVNLGEDLPANANH